MPGTATFVDFSSRHSPPNERESSGSGAVVNVTWLGSIPVPGIPSIRQFAEAAGGHLEAHALHKAARAITTDWFSSRPSGWHGVHIGQLIEDPLGIVLTELGLYTAAVRSCLLELEPTKLYLAGPKRSKWLRWAESIACSMGVRTEWRQPDRVRDVAIRAANTAWPSVSPLLHAGARHVRKQSGKSRRSSTLARYLIVAESHRREHLNTLHRVANELDGEIDWLLPWNPDIAPLVRKWLEDGGRSCLDLRDYFAWESARIELAERLVLSRIASAEATRLLRTHLPDRQYAWTVFRSAMSEAAWRMAPRAKGLSIAARRLIRDRDPRSILMISDYNYTNRIVAVAANAQHVPTVHLQHGLWAGSDDNPMWGMPVLTTKVALWNDFSGDWYRNHGVDDNRLVVTGNPRYDCFSQPIPETDQLPPSSAPLVLIITDAGPVAETAAILSAARQAVLQLPFRARVFVKLHPTEAVADVLPLLGDWGEHDVTVQREGDSTALVRQATVTVAITSSVIVESLLGGCPVVLISYVGFHKTEFHPESPLLIANTEAEAIGSITALLTNEGYAAECRDRCREFTRKHWPMCGSGAASRVAGLLRELGHQ
jgi:hypothetical protein